MRADIYLFSNEDVFNTARLQVKLKQSGECLIYEPWDNKCYKSEARGGVLDLTLDMGNMLFVIFGDEIPKDAPPIKNESARVKCRVPFEMSLLEEGRAEPISVAKSSEPFDITAPDKYPEFSGKIIYEGAFTPVDGFDVIDLGQVGDVAEVYLNGKYLGARINAPYKFSMKGALTEGENRIRVEVTSGLGHRRRDWLSSFMQISPTGLLGDIHLCKYI